jgi:hypothetical protein
MKSPNVESLETPYSDMSLSLTRLLENASASMNIEDYSNRLKAARLKVLAGSQGTLWVGHGPFLGQVFPLSQNSRLGQYGPLVMQRRPYFALHLPSREEIRAVFRRSHVPLISFAVNSSEVCRLMSTDLARRPIMTREGYLYVCRDPHYSFEKLGQSARSHIRRSFDAFEFRFVSLFDLLRLGMQAYSDTLARFGLPQPTLQIFERQIVRMRAVNRYIGALKDGRLEAFLAVTETNEWATMGINYSADEALPLRPNNGLLYYAVHHYLAKKKLELVDHGWSNFPITPKVETLHRFKVKMGFEALPIQRVFLVSPLLEPFVNEAFWKLARGLLTISPHSRMLQKVEVALRVALRIPPRADCG